MDILEDKLFEIISVYFSNNYFCSLYTEACNYYNDDKFPTIEQAYSFTIDAFNQAMRQTKSEHGKQNNFYPSIMNSIKNTYNEYMNKNISYNSFMELLARTLIPFEIYDDLVNNTEIKNKIIRAIMIKVVSKFTVYILNEALDDVLSLEHRKSNDITILQNLNKKWKDIFKEILIFEKNQYRTITIAKRNGVNLDAGDISNNISEEIVEHLELRISELINERNIIIKERNKLAKYVKLLIRELRDIKMNIDNYEKNNEINRNQTKPDKYIKPPPKSVKSVKPEPISIKPTPIIYEPVIPAVEEFKQMQYNEVDIIQKYEKPVKVEEVYSDISDEINKDDTSDDHDEYDESEELDDEPEFNIDD